MNKESSKSVSFANVLHLSITRIAEGACLPDIFLL